MLIFPATATVFPLSTSLPLVTVRLVLEKLSLSVQTPRVLLNTTVEKTVPPEVMFSLEEVECIGACCWAPAMQVNYDFHENLTPAKVDVILEDYAAGRGKDVK